MSGKLSTHALDIHRGTPAANLSVSLFRLEKDKAPKRIKIVSTNADGRTDGPLLVADEMTVGAYELIFGVGAYFRALGVVLPTPAFLDEVPIRFAISDASQAYHVPLLFSPWAYSTYRGS